MTNEERLAVSAWAETYYPTRAQPPPASLQRIQPDDLIWLFEHTQSRIAHLALVDQATVRHLFEPDQHLRETVRAAWHRTDPA